MHIVETKRTPADFFAARVRDAQPSPTLAVSDRARQLKAEGVDVVDLGGGDPDFITPEHIRQAAIEAASYEAHVVMQAEYDAKNPGALARLLKNGVKLRSFSREIMDACYQATMDVNDEEAAKNPKFRKIYDSWKRFVHDQNQWFSVAEASLQNYMINPGVKKKK